MQVRPTALPGLLLIDLDVHRDGRGFFVETYRAAAYRDAGMGEAFVQVNQSRSTRDTLRGLHAQNRRPQGKLVRVLTGEIFDVAVDIRLGSPHFARWVGLRLGADEFRQLYVPPGFAHGFCVLSDVAEVEYHCTDYYDPDGELRIRWDDPEIGAEWPVREPLLSPKDAAAETLTALRARLPVFEGPRR